ncbi:MULTISPECIES: Uma2 family endonuclease [Streptomyces]|uniref:Restriction endonuclease n=2 Tax=Streptomyces TaxID=1883 RepID=A0A100Y2U3_9ACTN|nr:MULTISPECIES: Uma2 family endonuclease [Streptomyces]KUH36642.1 restriction endonuclease [Streptomyces kanasensis]UUS32649.1 Uma2 family endonuclease [Streptomyces changanensis]
MSALAIEPEPPCGDGWDELVRIWEATDAPEGCKVEIIEGVVTVTPGPANSHNDTADLVQRRLYGVIPEDWGIYQTQTVAIPSRQGMFIPDLLVAPRAALKEHGHYVPLAVAELIVEITSRSNANHDRVEKLHGYATAGVPLYLLLDSWHSGRPTATLYGEPRNGMYRVLDTVKYGEELRLPAPFDLVLDTGEFPGA